MNQNLFPVVILAGGLATRLRPLTEVTPKALIDINGEPFIFHQLRLLQKNGIRKVIMCVGYLGEKIVDIVGDGKQFGLEISYSFDGSILLGTAGAIKKALPLFDENIFFVLYGDSYLLCDFHSAQKEFLISKKLSLMSVFHNKSQWDKSNVEFKASRIIAYDKKNRTSEMEYIDYGLGIFNKEAFVKVAPNIVFDLEHLYQELIKKDQLAAFEVKQRFYEVGSFKGIEEFKNFLKTNRCLEWDYRYD